MHSSDSALLVSTNPATGAVVWQGAVTETAVIDQYARAAEEAWQEWSWRTLEDREAVLNAFAEQIVLHEEPLARLIGKETGKPLWEARTEVKAMHGKIAISIEAHRRRCGDFTGGPAITRFRPHGVVAVLGPYNFPGHLPNGHIAPALLAGNAVLFKPSELVPGVGQYMVDLWKRAGVPDGLLLIIYGGGEQGAALCAHPLVRGIFFTGSERVGRKLEALVANKPGTILALEMGGNNPLVIGNVGNIEAAAQLAVQSAYLSAGQRCTCARRILVPKGPTGDAWLEAFVSKVSALQVGMWDAEPQPFMGCLVSESAADRVLAAQQHWLELGAKVILPCRRLDTGRAFLSPGLLDVTGVQHRPDEEIFGPLPLLIRTPDYASAVQEAGATGYGLAAGLFSDSAAEYEYFRRHIRAGIINWNQQLTGASSAAPFGGVGRSGNFRPSAFFAADYCSYPVASIENPQL